MQEHRYIAKTLFGLEDVLVKELEQLGAKNIEKLHRAVQFEGDKTFLYSANLNLRTALRIIQPIWVGKVGTAEELYDAFRSINWQTYLNTSSTFVINSFVNDTDRLTSGQFVSLKAKDAIADQFNERFGQRPSIDKEYPDLYIDIHINRQECTISLDSSGESLNRRGYRSEADLAPMNEVLAAGMVLLSGWDGKGDFVDFMCGSGTIAIEAILYARNIAPGKFRRKFAFMHWPDFDLLLWRKVQSEAERKEKPFRDKIMVSDVSEQAVEIAQRNVKRAGLEEDIIVERKDFRRVRPGRGPGVVMVNPPYGERIGDPEEIEELYWTIGDHLKDYYHDYHAWIFSGQKGALRRIDMMKPDDRIRLLNGSIECELAHYYVLPPKE